MWMACLCMLAMLVANCGKKISETQELAEKYMEAQKNEDVDAMFECYNATKTVDITDSLGK